MKLGECYRNGFGTEQDLREAISCFEKATKGNKDALICLGYILINVVRFMRKEVRI